MKEIILMAIRFYQATHLMRLPACRFYPSCSDYAQQAIEIHGALKGLLLALFRLSRCHPFTKGGTDFPPPLCHSEPLSLCHSERSEESSAANLARRRSPAPPNPVYTLGSP